jgi:hypothetical protein
MIFEGKLLKVHESDWQKPVILKIKTKFNSLVMKDEVYTSRYNGKNYKGHSAWKYMYNVLTWVNQLRWKHFQFESISHDDLYRPKLK